LNKQIQLVSKWKGDVTGEVGVQQKHVDGEENEFSSLFQHNPFSAGD